MQLLLKGFACYRLAKMITDKNETGPFDIFHHFRSYVGVYDLGSDGKPQGTIGKLFECPYCVGVWMAFILAICPKNKVTDTIVLWFAIAGLQATIQGVMPE